VAELALGGGGVERERRGRERTRGAKLFHKDDESEARLLAEINPIAS